MHHHDALMNHDDILVVGGDGWIGGALASELQKAGVSVWRTSRRPGSLADKTLPLDLDSETASWIPPRSFRAAFLGAAVSTLRDCRADPVRTRNINVRGLTDVARTLMARGTFVVYPSTNHVFDGTRAGRLETEAPCPVSEYGRQKADAERAILQAGPAAVVRLTKVLGEDRPPIPEWLKSLRAGSPIHPFSDLLMAPVPREFVVRVLEQILRRRLGGIFHVSSPEEISYSEAATFVARRIGAPENLIQHMRAAESPSAPEYLPAHTTLDTTRLREELGMKAPGAFEALDSVIAA